MYVSSAVRRLEFAVENCLFLAPFSNRVWLHDLLDSGPAADRRKELCGFRLVATSLRSIELVAIVHQSTFSLGQVKIWRCYLRTSYRSTEMRAFIIVPIPSALCYC